MSSELLRLPLKVSFSSGLPCVSFVIESQPTVFIVDTGTPFTSVNSKTVESWGLTDAIQPGNSSYYQGVVYADVTYDSEQCRPEPGDSTACLTVAKKFRFRVLECSVNLLGLDFLVGTRSDLRLDKKPSLCVHQLAKPVAAHYSLRMVISVNGRDAEAMPDTACSGLMNLTNKMSKSLGLKPEKMNKPVTIET